MTLKEKMKQGPVFGMACFTGTTCVIENIAMSGLDFIYLDLEHTDWMLGEDFEKQIMAAKLHDISVLVRMADDPQGAGVGRRRGSDPSLQDAGDGPEMRGSG